MSLLLLPNISTENYSSNLIFLLDDHYISDIVNNNPFSSSGKVVKAFAELTKALWLSGRKAFKPTALKVHDRFRLHENFCGDNL